MNMLVRSAEVEYRGPLTKSGVRHPPIRAFMEHLTMTNTSVLGSRWIQERSGGTDHLGSHELQTSEIQISGAKEGQDL